MFIIYRNAEATEAAAASNGIASPEEAVETTKEVTTEAPTEEKVVTDDNLEEEDEGFSDWGSESATTQQAANGAEVKTVDEKVVSEKQFLELQAKFNELQTQYNSLTAGLNNPIVKASIEYAAARESGVDLDPQDFYREKFGLDAKRMSEEELLREGVLMKAQSLNVNLTAEELEEELDEAKQRFNEKGRLEKADYLNSIRTQIAKQSDEKLKSLVSGKNEEAEKVNAYWEQQRNAFSNKLESELKAGRKSFGLKVKMNEQLAKEIETANANDCVRFKEDGSIDVEHAIEVRLFASDIQRYVKTLIATERKKWEKEQFDIKANRETAIPNNNGMGKPTVSKGGDMSNFSLDKAKKIPITNQSKN